MTTDNRTNEPTPEQVEAAGVAFNTFERNYLVLTPLEKHHSRIRAALVAAQGAAPQLIGRLDLARHYWRSQGYDYDLHGLDGNSDYEMGLAVADAALAALAAAQGAAPVLPSSTVDEGKIADEMERHRHVMVAPGPHRCSCGFVLTEDPGFSGWAKEHKLHVARAVVEAIGGEGR